MLHELSVGVGRSTTSKEADLSVVTHTGLTPRGSIVSKFVVVVSQRGTKYRRYLLTEMYITNCRRLKI